MFQTFDDTAATEQVADRVAKLRAAMMTAKISAFLVPRGDEHRGEYVGAYAERLRWLTAFSGSAGIAAVTEREAVLFVDGRYTVQARAQTDTDLFELEPIPDVRPEDWLAEHLEAGETVGFDPWLHSIGEVERLTARLKNAGIKLRAVARNPVDHIWGDDRPAPPVQPVTIQPMTQAGENVADKIARMQQELTAAKDDAVVLTQPDSICWLLNIRGNDVAHNPVVLAFAILPRNGPVELFVASQKIGPEVAEHLAPVAQVYNPNDLRQRLAHYKQANQRVRVGTETTAYWFKQRLGSSAVIGSDPCIAAKAIKNKAEIRGARNAQLRDGVAVCRFLAWLDRESPSGTIDEIGAAQALEAFRSASGKLLEISFDTISGSGSNGAIVHYRVNTQTNRTLKPGGLYLVDSGGQYRDGTTDITRTIAIGQPSAEMRERFTLVLKGHIAIATAQFPVGTRGVDLDPFARAALWQHGLDYDHGTGHGIGSYLSVHEGPQSISRRGMAELKPGMIISNEPGYYKERAYGIRLENLVLVSPARKPKGGERPMMSFETLTLAPFDRRLIDVHLLSDSERAWLDTYHQRVVDAVGPRLDAQEREWLETATGPLT